MEIRSVSQNERGPKVINQYIYLKLKQKIKIRSFSKNERCFEVINSFKQILNINVIPFLP